MASTIEDTFFDFDINFLRQTPANTDVQCKLDKYRKSISVLKKKTIATNSLIKKYCAKREQFEQSERNLVTTKEECRKICIDYSNALETCAKLEHELHISQSKNKELEEQYFNAQNQCIGMKSHANQLQQLIKEYESKIEALKLETNLNKSNIKSSDKVNEKQVRSLKKENNTLRKHISLLRDALLGKRKLKSKHKLLLQKYEPYDGSCSESGAENSDHDDYLFSSPPSPICMDDDAQETNCKEVVKAAISAKEVIHINMSSANDILEISKRNENDGSSVDTGRGSSLACSDSEKCIQSPSYFLNDSPLSDISPLCRQENQCTDAATSPIYIIETVEDAPSTLSFNNNTLPKAIEPQQTKLAKITTDTVVVNTISDCLTTERTTSPVETNKDTPSIFSPQKDTNADLATVAKNNNKFSSERHVSLNKTIQERACLELNNSNNFYDENSNDCEIETILKKMRLSYNLVTPIPETPAKSIRESACRSTTAIQQPERAKHEEDMAQLMEKNEKLTATVDNLVKAVVNIQEMLQNQVLPHIKPLPSAVELDLNTVHPMIFINEMEALNTTERPPSVQTTILEHEEPVMIRSPSPCMEDIETSNNELFIHEPHDVIETNNSLVTEVNNTSRLRLEFEDTIPFPDESGSLNNRDTPEVCKDFSADISDRSNHLPSVNGRVYMRPNRQIKLSKLGLLKKKMLPKSKIRRDIKQTQRRKRLRLKPVIVKKKRKVLDSDNSASLNEKSVYEKAIKVLSDIKANKHGTDGSQCVHKVINVTCNNSSNTDSILKLIDEMESRPKLTPPKNTSIKKLPPEVANVNNNINLNDLYEPYSSRDNNSNKINPGNKPVGVDKTPEANEQFNSKYNEVSLSPSYQRLTRSTAKNRTDIGKAHINMEKIITIDLQRVDISQNIKNHQQPFGRRSILKRRSQYTEHPEMSNKRILRSSTANTRSTDNIKQIDSEVNAEVEQEISTDETQNTAQLDCTNNDSRLSYNDLDMFTKDNDSTCIDGKRGNNNRDRYAVKHYDKNVLCSMLQKHGVAKVKFGKKNVSDRLVNSISEKLEQSIEKIVALPPEKAKSAMDDLVSDISNNRLKVFVYGLMKYLHEPARKLELFKKVITPPAPAMSKSEQVLIYIITQLKNKWTQVDLVDKVLTSIEFTLFAINRTPEFAVIESMSHFYAVLCRYFKAKSRLRLFILDAMYCLQFKSIPLIKQCIEVWMHILPLAHMGIAKTPLVTCMVYLLHFYKCDDKFNRVTEIRTILNRKYFFNITNWNEHTILDMFRTAIMDLKGNSLESKMLRIGLIILGKRLGPRWCQKNIVNNLLKPIIEKNNVRENIRVFCIGLLGPLLKPYPLDMKVHCEIITNELVDMLDKPATKAVQEAIVTSLLCLSRHNQNHVILALLNWESREVSPELEDMLKDFVKTKPVKVWKSLITNILK